MSNTPAQPSASPQIESPCNKTCTIDLTTGLCLGCFRTRDEIGLWSSISAAERRQIMAELPSRQHPIKR